VPAPARMYRRHGRPGHARRSEAAA